MKKTIAVLLAACLIFTGTAAFAEGSSKGEPKGGTPEMTQETRMFSERLSPQFDEIRENRSEMLKLREEVRSSYSDAKDKIGDMIRNRDELRLEQVEELRDSMERLRESRRILAGTIGEVEETMTRLRTRIRNRNQEGASETLGECIQVQTMRMEELRKVLSELESINDM